MVIGEVDTGFGNSFCCLESTHNNYVQALHGLNGWHLEWRVTDPDDNRRYRHYRAENIEGSNRRLPLFKSNYRFSLGLERDLLDTEDVVQCFLAFHRSGVRPKGFKWRRLRF